MTFIELQKRIVQTRKARRGVKNRTDYFDDDWQEEEFCKELYKRALRAANEVVKHYEIYIISFNSLSGGKRRYRKGYNIYIK